MMLPANVAAVVFTLGALIAQGPPSPAPELKKLAALVGNWGGEGEMHEPGGATTRWSAAGTYAWCLDGHFLQEDFQIRFAGTPAPLVFRAYFGWDSENAHYVAAIVNNGGATEMHEMHLLPDGTFVQMMLQNQQGVPYAERALFKVEGDTMTHSIDLLMATGKSLSMIDGKFTRGGKGFSGAFDAPTWMGAKADPAIARLVRSAGTYEVTGSLVPMPGAAAMAIKGTDTFRAAFDGTVLHGRTEGEAEGMPGKYVGDVFWGFDARRRCLSGVYVSNFGEVQRMDARWTADGRLLTVAAIVRNGQPEVQRTLMEFDANGAAKAAIVHSIAGTADPMVSFRATYKRQQ